MRIYTCLEQSFYSVEIASSLTLLAKIDSKALVVIFREFSSAGGPVPVEFPLLAGEEKGEVIRLLSC